MKEIRETWDAAAALGQDHVVGVPGQARAQLEALFGRVGATPGGSGRCVEIGCGTGRMTEELAPLWDEVVAVDVSPLMLERAREAVQAPNVSFRLVSGEDLAGVESASAQAVVCYGVFQHLPRRPLVAALFGEIGRVLAPGGEAFVQMPQLHGGVVPAVWRAARAAAMRLLVSENVTTSPAYRGTRLTRGEIERALRRAGLCEVARDETPSHYGRSVELVLRLAR
jgi:ubiquinone/menaquinone biosynthesis C-methylase UbiE